MTNAFLNILATFTHLPGNTSNSRFCIYRVFRGKTVINQLPLTNISPSLSSSNIRHVLTCSELPLDGCYKRVGSWFIFMEYISTMMNYYQFVSWPVILMACRRCSNYIFILNLTPGFNGLGKDNCKTRQETFMFWDWMGLILENWW